MQKIFLWFMFLTITSFAFSLNTTSQVIEENYLYQNSSSGGSVVFETGESYVIVDGPGAGTVIIAAKDEPTSILEINNPLTKANGHIGGIGEGEGMNCPGPLGHFHGTLNNKKDPAEDMCGWGHVAVLKDTSNGVMGIASGYGREILIVRLVEKEPPDYNGAASEADTAAMDLAMLQDDIRDPSKTMIGKGMAHQISDKLGKAINADKFVVMTLNPVPEQRDIEKDAAIILKINNALKAKQEALTILRDAEAMAAAMAMGK